MDKITIERETLLPCPFCGAEAEIITLEGETDNPSIGAQCVQCTNSACGSAGGLIYPLMDDVRHLLLERWNRRTALAQKAEPPAPKDPVAQWQKRHHRGTEGKWENTDEHDAKWWRASSSLWDIRALYAAPQAWRPDIGEVVVTRNDAGEIVAVTRQDDEGRILSVIAESAAPPAPAAVPPDGMDTVAIKYAHKMALDLECILAEYGGSWYNTAMQTLGKYRSEMNAIHERECPTFMGEPVIAAAGDKP